MRRRRRKIHQASSNPFIESRKRTGIKRSASLRRRRSKPDVSKVRGRLLGIAETLFAVSIGFLVVWSVGIRVDVVGESMEPTLYDGDEVLINRVGMTFFPAASGSLVAFLPGGNKDASISIKRVIAGPNDSVRIENGSIYVNDSLYEEGTASDYIEEAGVAESQIELGADEYFCLGDNRNNSQDSRYESVGNIKRSDIIGTVWFEISGSHFGFLQ